MKKISVLLAALLIVSLLPATAIAQEDTTRTDDSVERIIENLKDRAEKAIEKRLDTIERVTEALEESEHLTDEHERVLLDELGSSAAGLTELGRQIEEAGTIEELRELIPLIFEDYRIYAVVVPKAHLVLREAVALAGPVPDTVLPLVPADWPDPAQEVLEGAHSDLRSARDNVGSAIRSAHEVGRILRELLQMG